FLDSCQSFARRGVCLSLFAHSDPSEGLKRLYRGMTSNRIGVVRRPSACPLSVRGTARWIGENATTVPGRSARGVLRPVWNRRMIGRWCSCYRSNQQGGISAEPRGTSERGIRELSTPGVATFEALDSRLAGRGAG